MKRVLFVDDETALLDGLRARLRHLRGTWEMVFVESASRALTEMEHARFDVVVSDMRMPFMDGAQLLATVAQRWPETARIVFSGYAEDERTARLLAVAHQYVSKPCDVRQIEATIDRCACLQRLLSEPRLRAVVGRITQLPTIPRVYAQLRAAMSCDNVSVRDVAAIVAADVAVTAKVLQVVNSSFFRLARRITRIDQAVSHLGFAAIRNIVMSVEVFSQWRTSPIRNLVPEKLQARAQQIAAVAHAIADGTSMADDAMLAGLLHNIGYRVLLQECPADLDRALALAAEQSIPLHAAERQIIGTSHAEIGAYLLGLWGLPNAVVEAVAFQHAPEAIAHTEFDVLAALVIAKSLVAAGTEETATDEQNGTAAADAYLRSLHAPFTWTEAQQRMSKVSGEIIQ